MKVKDVMTRPPLTARRDDSVELALQIMGWGEVRHLPIVDEGRLVGVVSERDLLSNRERGRTLGEVMSSPVQTARPDDDLAEAAARMVRERLGCLPVVANNELLGMVTVTDVVAAQAGMSGQRDADQVTAGEVMTRLPLTVSPEDLLFDAVARMAVRQIRHAPVVDGEGRVLGMLSDRDVRLALGATLMTVPDAAAPVRVQLLKVRDVMSRDPILVALDTSLYEVATALRFRNVGALPVVDRAGRIAGIISYVDLLREFLGRRQSPRRG